MFLYVCAAIVPLHESSHSVPVPHLLLSATFETSLTDGYLPSHWAGFVFIRREVSACNSIGDVSENAS